jgi:hypothetical protein
MGIIIRTSFNNQHWASNCKNADRDRRLFKCRDKVIDVHFKVDKNGFCIAKCWEQNLCKNYKWECLIGEFDKTRAKGYAFFVFPDINKLLVLWGFSKIERVDGSTIYFKKFKPLPTEKWIYGLSSKDDLLGKDWDQGTYRYINDLQESKIKELIDIKDELLEDPIEIVITDQEGRSSLRNHLYKERSSKLVAAFKQSLSNYDCCICGFNFERTYGKLGKNFIEAHHTKPVAYLKEGEVVSIKDFVAVCSNCHRIIHRENPPLDCKKIKIK